MRRLRLMSREEQLLRETVRNILLEVDKDVEDLYKQQGISLGSDEEHFFSSIGSVADITGVLLNAGGPTFIIPNLIMDALSFSTAWMTWDAERERYDKSKESLAALQRKNQPAIDPAILRKFEQYLTVRFVLSSCLLTLSGISVIGSLVAMLPTPPTFLGGSFVEIAAKGGKIVIGVAQLLDAEGTIDLSGTVSGAIDKLKSVFGVAVATHDRVTDSSQYAKVVNEVIPDIVAIYQNPAVKQRLTSGAAVFGSRTTEIVNDLYACVDIISDYRDSVVKT